MNVLHVNATDIRGGAARAAWRIHRAMVKENVNSSMAVLEKCSDDWHIWNPSRTVQIYKKFTGCVESILRKKIAAVPGTLPWSLNFFDNHEMVQFINNSKADVVNLHWINNSCLSVNDIDKIQKPLVWTLHDTWAFTGGCHYFGECNRYQSACLQCPQAQRHWGDLAKFQYRAKEHIFSTKNIEIITPSVWLGACASKSRLLERCKVNVIPNTIDQTLYRPLEKNMARSVMGIAPDQKVILFGADCGTRDPRKGYDLLCSAMQKLRERLDGKERILLAVFGASEPVQSEGFPFEVRYFGHLHDDYSLILLYNSADVFVAPSREDNLPNTILEAMSCGTSCVGFAIGGIPDMIVSGKNGYLAHPFDDNDLSYGIQAVLHNSVVWGSNARKKMEQQHEESHIVKKYINVYEDLLRNMS